MANYNYKLIEGNKENFEKKLNNITAKGYISIVSNLVVAVNKNEISHYSILVCKIDNTPDLSVK